jgi:hypothetical protein
VASVEGEAGQHAGRSWSRYRLEPNSQIILLVTTNFPWNIAAAAANGQPNGCLDTEEALR